MGMIQIDMPMPNNCLDCPACNEYLTCSIPVNGRKWGENDVREFGQDKPEWCPMKEQEAAKPEMEHSGSGVTWWNVCGNCKTAINPNDKFCHECGRPILWEGIEFTREFMSDAVHETAKQFRRQEGR